MMVRTRFSPSPTGMIHLGNARAALFSVLFARAHQGKFILRIEDTDQSRSEHQYTEAIQTDLKWLGLCWQEGPDGGPCGPYLQSERHPIYEKYYDQLEAQHAVYPCFCTDQELLLTRKMQLAKGMAPRYAGTCRHLSSEEVQAKLKMGLKPAWRFIVPSDQKVMFVDLIKGEQVFYTNDIGDFIIRRQDRTASFLFCNAVDDANMKITHVFRGEDHLTNTSRQLLILKALGLHAPYYGHLSLIVGEDGAPLSKRIGAFSLRKMKEEGYLPVAINNYLARLGHSMNQSELLTLEALATLFQVDKLSRSPSRFDQHQLLHWQKIAVSSLSDEAFKTWSGIDKMQDIPLSQKTLFAETIKQNVLFPREVTPWEAICFGALPPLTEDNKKIIKEAGEDILKIAIQAVDMHGADWDAILKAIQADSPLKGKALYMPLRLALTGESHGPHLQQIVTLLGQDKIKHRLEAALHDAHS